MYYQRIVVSITCNLAADDLWQILGATCWKRNKEKLDAKENGEYGKV